MTITEQNIILELQKGNKSGFKKFYMSKRDKFSNWARKKFKLSKQDTLELYQESMVKLYENIIKPGFDLKTNLESYLYGLAKNIVSGEIRKQEVKQRHQESVIEHWQSFYASEENTVGMKNVLLTTLPKIKEACRQLLKWFYFENKSLEDIVIISDYKNKNVVKTQKSRCLQYLEKQVKDNLKQEK